MGAAAADATPKARLIVYPGVIHRQPRLPPPPQPWFDVGVAEVGDRSLALHDAVLRLAAEGGGRLRSLWLPEWAVPPHQMVQWQAQLAQVGRGERGRGRDGLLGEKEKGVRTDWSL